MGYLSLLPWSYQLDQLVPQGGENANAMSFLEGLIHAKGPLKPFC